MNNSYTSPKRREAWRTPSSRHKSRGDDRTSLRARSHSRPRPSHSSGVRYDTASSYQRDRAPESAEQGFHVTIRPASAQQATILGDNILQPSDSPGKQVDIEIFIEDVFTHFLQEELDPKSSLWDLVILGGHKGKNGELDAFACTFGQYVSRAWPLLKDTIEQFVVALRLKDGKLQNQAQCIPTQYGHVYTHLYLPPDGVIRYNFSGPSGAVAPLVSATRLLTAVVQRVNRDEENGSEPERPIVLQVTLNPNGTSQSMPKRRSYRLAVDSSEALEVPNDSSCWTALFPNTPCMLGPPAPVRPRPDGMKGVEISFELMCLLSGVDYEVEEEDGLVLYGARTMLYPIREYQGCVQWHMEKLGKGGLPETVRPFRKSKFRDLESLVRQSHFLGMWEDTRVLLGAESMDNRALKKLAWSMADEVSKETSRNGWSAGGTIGLPKVLSLSATQSFAVAEGRKPQSMANFAANFHRNIQTPVIIYCPSEERAWLVSYTSVALHLARVRAAHQFESLGYVVPGCEALDDGGAAAFELVNSHHQQPVKKAKPGEDLSDDDKEYTIGCYINEVIASMEVARRKSCRAHDILKPLRNKLLGFELADIAFMKSKMRLKGYSLGSLPSGCWGPLLEEVEYVFFCEGLSDPIIPSPLLDYRGACRQTMWPTIPRGFNLLTASIPVMIDLAREHNSTQLRRITATHDWKSSRVSCNCGHPERHFCSGLQEFAKKGSGRAPNLDIHRRKGAVVFKYARDFREICDNLKKRPGVTVNAVKPDYGSYNSGYNAPDHRLRDSLQDSTGRLSGDTFVEPDTSRSNNHPIPHRSQKTRRPVKELPKSAGINMGTLKWLAGR